MRKRIYTIGMAACLLFTVACSAKKEDGKQSESQSGDSGISISEGEWVEKDLSTIDPELPVILKAPKNAKIEKIDLTGEIEITVNDQYALSVSKDPSFSAEECVKFTKDFLPALNDLEKDASKLTVFENGEGIIYSEQRKDWNAPRYHFCHCLVKGEDVYRVESQVPLKAEFTVKDNSVYSKELARKMYDLVKSSAKVK